MKTEGWRGRLQKFLWKRIDTPFEWFENDCFTFAGDAVEQMIEEHPGKYLDGRPYKTSRGAFKQMKKLCGGNMDAMAEKMAEALGGEEVYDPQFGDIVLMRIENLDEKAVKMFGGVTTGLMCNEGYVTSPGADGLIFNLNPLIIRAWRI